MGSQSNSGVSVTASPLVLELLAWIARWPRTYDETMEAWRTSCPRHSVWEDAWIDGMVEVVVGDDMNRPAVVLTARGQATLDGDKKTGPNRPG